MTKLTDVQGEPAFVVIIRAIWCRGKDQSDALAELNCRGLWLTRDQRRHDGLEG